MSLRKLLHPFGIRHDVNEDDYMLELNHSASFIKNFEEIWPKITSADPSWLKELRLKSRKRFEQLGFPSLKDEEWKYTNLTAILRHKYQISSASGSRPRREESSSHAQLRKFIQNDPICLVFLDGTFMPEYSSLKDIPSSVKILKLSEAVKNNDAYAKKLLTHYDPEKEPVFAALNKALTPEGTYIYLDAKTVFEKFIHIVHVASAQDEHLITFPRSLIYLRENAQATILESHVSFSNEPVYFSVGLTDIFLEENAVLHYCKGVKESDKAFNINTTRVWQENNSNFNGFSFTAGGSISRSNLDVVLNGQGINARLDGLYAPYGTQLVDNHTSVDHKLPHCTSSQLYKGILNGASRAVFNGKIFVRPPAQGTNSYQLNKNLLLGKDCGVDTKPQLEIGADDVKCTHGATIGQLNEDELFYLQARAIPKKTAVKMLARGFVDDIINRIPSPIIREKCNILLKDAMETI